MEKMRRSERIAMITKILVENPNELFPLGFFADMIGAAKSTLSEDITLIKKIWGGFKMGKIETLAGANGGVKFIPYRNRQAVKKIVTDLCQQLANPSRIIPGGYLYMTDLIFSPKLVAPIGEIFAAKFGMCQPDYIVTVETKGIPLALMTARAMNLPLVIIRDANKVTEGSVVSVNYVSASSKRIQTMSLSRRALPTGAKVVLIDDFMKAGSTARGVFDLMQEFEAEVMGTGVLIETAEPREKLIDNYLSLVVLHRVDESKKEVEVYPSKWVQMLVGEEV